LRDVKKWGKLFCPFCGRELINYEVCVNPIIDKETACCVCEKCNHAFVIIYKGKRKGETSYVV